ncbi:MAG: 16S rRNA (uracil(1498)-N(3))-methyltransferase [Bacillota bacterium]|nr:16S rRNA (uracil(1498)-N(3))-methyltransferase [Bacillota bacterium]HOB42941.1 16S rRNA (uracil(1498)-N(3))-methyltransferase [Bacillota bacterium]HOL52656.1 16S rRNA (uracil(1498)-N(3))-methyltransferase [Bacillota bacterium]HOO30557.1 16S rRNA (uracil(1498)-N(3))-methyltransferase [Bacillota bacterium]HPZ13909.1 16S rRNA (uracil(1498)-N(3))-methyltransferase [Bacillota bacterium]
MRRFFVGCDAISGDLVTISGRDARHIVKALRLKLGDAIVVVDGVGRRYVARITATRETTVEARIESMCDSGVSEPHVPITLVQGLPKADKMDGIIQKCTEIGIARIIPVMSERSVLRPDGASAERRMARWRRIAEEAAKQSGREAIPLVADIGTLKSAIEMLRHEGALMVFPWELEQEYSLHQALSELNPSSFPSVGFFIGPEGGFSHAEVEYARAHGATTVTLGQRILRTETAGPVVAAIILYHMGELG